MAYKFVQYIFYPSQTQDPAPPYGLPAPYTLQEEARYRAIHMLKVLDYARDFTPELAGRAPVTGVKNSEILKIFLAPEFFFRSATGRPDGSGHYSLFDVQCARAVIRDGVLKDSRFDDWFVLPGTAIYCQRRANQTRTPVIFNEGWVLARSTATSPKVEFTTQKRYFSDVDGLDHGKAAMLDTSPLAKLRRHVNWQIIEYGGVYIGFEICLDHRQQALKQTVTTTAPPFLIDIHLLVSCGMEPLRTSVAARAGGYFIRCNGNEWATPRAQLFQITAWPGGGVPSFAAAPTVVNHTARMQAQHLPAALQIHGPAGNDYIGYSDYFRL